CSCRSPGAVRGRGYRFRRDAGGVIVRVGRKTCANGHRTRVARRPVRGWQRRATTPSRRHAMAAMKPRTGDGPLEVVEEGRSISMRVPLEGGGRLVVEIAADEAAALRDALEGVIKA